MQETEYQMPDEQKKLLKQFFGGQTYQEIRQKMDDRLTELQQEGHTLVRRVKVSRNAPCPCGSGKKFKRCHLSQCE